MAFLGFHPPQFSEDVAWLPAWLQPHVVMMPSDENSPSNEDRQVSSNQSHKVVARSKENNRGNEDPRLLTNKVGQFYCDYLHLSRDDEYPLTISPSLREEMCQFDLHLSADGASSTISNLVLDIAQAKRVNPSDVASLQPVNSLIGHMETRQSNIDNGLRGSSLFHSTSKLKRLGNLSHPISSNAVTGDQRDTQHFNEENSDGTDVDDAVELSVAASEALVIHELLQDESFPELFPGTAILELALRLMQARVEGLKNSCSIETSDNKDVLSDRNNSYMEEVYKNMGTFANDSTISCVKNSPVPQSLPRQERKAEGEHKTGKEMLNHNLTKEHPENNFTASMASQDTSFEILGHNNQKMCNDPCNNPALDFISERTNHDNFKINQLGHLALPQEGDASAGPKCQTGKNIKKPLVGVTSYLSESAIGVSDENSFAHDHNPGSSIKNPLVGLNSYFPEFANAVPDENSSAKDYHVCSKTSESILQCANFCRIDNGERSGGDTTCAHNHHLLFGAPKLHLQGVSRTASGRALVCPDDKKDSSLSDNDPLCSIVPCSIDTEKRLLVENNIGQVLGNDKVCGEDSRYPLCSIVPCSVGTEKRPFVENNIDQVPGNDKICRDDSRYPLEKLQMSCVCINAVVDREHDKLVAVSVGSHPVIHRKMNSLKAYSMGFSKTNPCLQWEYSPADLADKVECNASMLSHKQPLNCVHLSKKDPMKPMSMGYHSRCSSPDYSQGNNSAYPTENALEMTGHINPLEAHTESGLQMQASMENNERLPLIHPQRKICQLQVCPVANVSNKNGIFALGSVTDFDQRELLVDCHPQLGKDAGTLLPRKRVRFSEVDITHKKRRNIIKLPVANEIGLLSRKWKRSVRFNLDPCLTSQEVKDRLRNCHTKGRKRRLIFQGLDFLVTGFCHEKQKEIEGLLRKHGGMVLSDIPCAEPKGSRILVSDSHQLPVVLSKKKLQTTKFLYGCAVNAFLLKIRWVADSIEAGSVLLPEKYMILANQVRQQSRIGKSVCQDQRIFDKVGIMLLGRDSFCSKMGKVIKHGRGCIFKSLQWMLQSLENKKISVGVIVAENQACVSRHLRMCASELKIPLAPGHWIVTSLYAGKLLPFKEEASLFPCVKKIPVFDDWSQEI